MNHGSLFSGIGGFDLAAEWCGWENVFHCEYNPFGQRVLKHYWPDSISYGDIKQTDFTIHRGQIDVLSGGFPCQPFSSAGKRRGTEDDRHLWPEMLRAIREISPRYVVGENVRGFTNWNGGMVFDQVQADLEAEGYEVLPFLLPACAVNAPHRRDRIWIVAHKHRTRLQTEGAELKATGIAGVGSSGASENPYQDGRNDKRGKEEPKERGFGDVIAGDSERIRIQEGTTANAMHNGRSGWDEVNTNQRGFNALHDVSKNEGEGTAPYTGDTRSQRRKVNGSTGTIGQKSHQQSTGFIRPGWENFPTQPPIRQRNDGLSPELSGITVSRHRKESIMAYGNAIVPQVAFEIFKVISKMTL